MTFETITGDEVRAMMAGATIEDLRRAAPAASRPPAGPAAEPHAKPKPARGDEPGGLAGGRLPVPDPA